MSGGSYDYLYCKELEELVNAHAVVERMADRLAGLGYAEDAARATMDVLLELRRVKVRVETMSEKLSGVWRAMEWWDSSDSSEEGFREALAKYRGECLKATDEVHEFEYGEKVRHRDGWIGRITSINWEHRRATVAEVNGDRVAHPSFDEIEKDE